MEEMAARIDGARFLYTKIYRGHTRGRKMKVGVVSSHKNKRKMAGRTGGKSQNPNEKSQGADAGWMKGRGRCNAYQKKR